MKHDRKLVEVQIRTTLQHLWAEFSEKMADQLDPALKYGGGDQLMIKTLLSYSSAIARGEAVIEKLGIRQGKTEQDKKSLEEELKSINREVSEGTQALIAILSRRRNK